MQIIQDQQLTTCSLRGKMFSRHCTELGQPTCVCGGVKWIECVQPAPRPPSDGGVPLFADTHRGMRLS